MTIEAGLEVECFFQTHEQHEAEVNGLVDKSPYKDGHLKKLTLYDVVSINQTIDYDDNMKVYGGICTPFTSYVTPYTYEKLQQLVEDAVKRSRKLILLQ